MENDEWEPTDEELLQLLGDAEKNWRWIDEQRPQLAKKYAKMLKEAKMRGGLGHCGPGEHP